MLQVRGIVILQEGEWFRLYDVFRASDRPDYKSPSRWLLSRSFHFLKKPKKVRVDTDYDIIWVRPELLVHYAKWISIHFQREVSEAINGYKLTKAAGIIPKAQTYQSPGPESRGAVRTEDHAYCQKGYFAQRRLQQDSTAVL